MIPDEILDKAAHATSAHAANCTNRPDCQQCRDVYDEAAATLEAALPAYRRLVRREVAEEMHGTAAALRALADTTSPDQGAPVASAETLRTRADLLDREARSIAAYAPGLPTEREKLQALRDQALERKVRAKVADEIASAGMSLRESADTTGSKALREKWSAAAKAHEDLAEAMRHALNFPAPPARPALEVLRDLVADRIRHTVRIRLSEHAAAAALGKHGVVLSGTEADLAADTALAAVREYGCGCDLDPVECSHEAARGVAEAEVARLRKLLGPSIRLGEVCGDEFEDLSCTLPAGHAVHFARGTGTVWLQLREDEHSAAEPSEEPEREEPATDLEALRAEIGRILRDAFDHQIVAEGICCDPVRPDHEPCTRADVMRHAVRGLLTDDPDSHPERSPILDALLDSFRPLVGQRDALLLLAERLPDSHAKLRVLGETGDVPCADWCYRCKLDRYRAAWLSAYRGRARVREQLKAAEGRAGYWRRKCEDAWREGDEQARACDAVARMARRYRAASLTAPEPGAAPGDAADPELPQCGATAVTGVRCPRPPEHTGTCWPPLSTSTVYASIGNSDDKLTQQRWSTFLQDFLAAIRTHAAAIHGEWFSSPTAPFQNASVCFEITEPDATDLRALFAKYVRDYGQDSIAWAVATTTEFITAAEGAPRA